MISSSFFRIFPAINLHLSSFIMGVPRFSHTFPGFSPRKAGVRSCRPGPPRGSCIEVRLLPSQLFVSHRRVILPLVNSRVAHGCTKKKPALILSHMETNVLRFFGGQTNFHTIAQVGLYHGIHRTPAGDCLAYASWDWELYSTPSIPCI